MATNTETVKTDVAQDPVIAQLQSVLTNEAERVSSQSTGIEDTISSAIKNTQRSGDASESRIQSQFGREQGDILRQGQRNVDNFAEGRSGFGTQLTALRNLTGQTDDYLKDLASRKEEALLLNDSQTANRIAELEVAGLQMKQKALQDTFQNLLSASSFGLQARQFELGQAENKRQFNLSYELEGEKFTLAKDQQSFEEQQALAGIALEFGLELNPTDTIDSVVERAAATGIVDERRALELEQLRASIRSSNAQAAKALRADPSEQQFDPITLDIIAKGIRKGQITAQDASKTPEQYASLMGRVQELDDDQQETVNRIAQYSQGTAQFQGYLNQLTAGRSESEVSRINSFAARAMNQVGAKAGESQYKTVGEVLREAFPDPTDYAKKSDLFGNLGN